MPTILGASRETANYLFDARPRLTARRRHASLAGLGVRLLSILVTSAALLSALGRARADEPALAPTESEVDAQLGAYFPAPVDGPSLRLPITPTRLYVDATYATSDDLSALPYIIGRGRNLRFAAGASFRWRQLAFTGELPFYQRTTLDLDEIMNQPFTTYPQDAHETAGSLGDLRLGVDWTTHLSDVLVGGFGLRGRFPTHTTAFRFHLADGSLSTYVFPYFFHIEPTAILGGVFGRWTFALNQGALVFVGPDGDFGGFHFVEPTLVFWDAHYAATYAQLEWLGASVELATDVQLNHVDGLDFQQLNHLHSVWVAPALQFHVDSYRVDLVARLGLSRGADLFGVIEYAGSRSYALRVSRSF